MLGTNYESIIEAYKNLLIIQYHDKDKAKATIDLLMRSLIPQDNVTKEPLLDEIVFGFNIDDAVGAQLDVIGQYIGLERFYKVISFEEDNYFAFTKYNESSIPPEKRGFTDYTDFDTAEGEILTYDKIVTNTVLLTDTDYRTLLKLKRIQNNSDHSHKSIDDDLFNNFGDELILSSANDMTMIYFFNENIGDIVELAALKDILPRPMGVGYNLVKQVNGGFFSFVTYDNLTVDNNMNGFSTYSNFDTVEGQIVNYDKIIEP